MIQVVCVNGKPGCGKTTFEELCIQELDEPWGTKTSTIDFIKKIAMEMGWDGNKTLESRAFLSDLKDLASRAPWGDVPLMQIKKFCNEKDFSLVQYNMAKHYTVYVFVDVREPENIKKLQDELGAISVLIRREAVENIETSNHADEEVFQYDYDITIDNNGTLEDLKKTVKNFIIDLRKFKGKEMWRF